MDHRVRGGWSRVRRGVDLRAKGMSSGREDFREPCPDLLDFRNRLQGGGLGSVEETSAKLQVEDRRWLI